MKIEALGKVSLYVVLAVVTVSCSAGKPADAKVAVQRPAYNPDFESLARHEDAPEWFRDAKLGIYFHWGVYSVPAYGSEWYPRHMHDKNHDEYKHHVEVYGEPTQFGYHDFVPMFKAEKFDANRWALLFKKAGAQFAGPVAEHHDGFAMWASNVTPWNVKDKWPHRDITGELEKAIRKHDMKFITTFHHARNSLWEKEPGKWSGHYSFIKQNFPSLLDNPENAILYGYMAREKFVKMWKNKLIEVIDNYQPDIIWFDGWLYEIPEKDRFEFAAHYFNKSNEWNKEVVIVQKNNDMPPEFTVQDYEKSRMSTSSKSVWMTDDTISTGSWSYTNNLKIKPTKKVVHALVDTVSKNGVVLLNISPKADGTIPADQEKVLLELGEWMRINGESIYATRPWITYGQGPTKEPEGGFGDHKEFLKLEYSAKDIRFTQSKDEKTLYAITLGWPKEPFKLELPQALNVTDLKVTLIGSTAKVSYTINEGKNLTVIPPSLKEKERPCKFAYVFKIEGF